MKNFVISILLLGTISAHALTQTYEGQSNIGQKESCSLILQSEGDKITGVKIVGSARSWEILSEKGGGYGPRSEVRANEELDLMADFSKYAFKQNATLLRNGIILKSTVSLGEAGIKSKVEVKLTRASTNEITRVTATQAFKVLSLFNLTSLEFDCGHLVLKGEQP